MSQSIDITAGTSGLLESLRSLRRKVKVLTVLRGVGIVLAAAVVLVLAVVLLDYQLRLPLAARIGVNLLALGALGYGMWRWVVQPALQRLTLSDLAGRIEGTFPQFDDTLRSTVAFAGRDVPGSAVMKARTVERATALAADVNFNKAVAARPVWGSLAIGLLAIAGLAVLTALVPDDVRKTAANRLFAGSSEWPKRVRLSVDQPAAAVAAGGEVKLTFRDVNGSATKAVVRYRYDNGQPVYQTVELKDGKFEVTLPAQLEAGRDVSRLDVQIQAGDDDAKLTPIRIVPPLDVRSAIAGVTPHKNYGLPQTEVNLAERAATVALGTTVELRLTFNKPIDTARPPTLTPNSKFPMPAVAWTFPRNGLAVGTFVVGPLLAEAREFRFAVRATDVDGLTNEKVPEYQLKVKPDENPNVRIEVPREDHQRTPESYVPMRIAADDDYGFTDVRMHVVRTNPDRKAEWTIPLVAGAAPQAGVTWQLAPTSTLERKRFTADYQWELSQLPDAKLAAGDRLQVRIYAADNFRLPAELSPTGAEQTHKPAESSPALNITLISQSELGTVIDIEAAKARQKVEAAAKAVDVARAQTEQQARDTAAKERVDDAHKKSAERLAEQQKQANTDANDAAKELGDIVQRMEENRFQEKDVADAIKKASEKVNEANKGGLQRAQDKLNEAKSDKADPAEPKPGDPNEKPAATPQEAAAKAQQAKAKAEQAKQNAAKSSKNLENAAADQREAAKQLEQASEQLSAFGGLAPAIKKLEDIKKKQQELAKEYQEKLGADVGKKPEEMSADKQAELQKQVEKQQQLAKEMEAAIKSMEAKSKKMEQSAKAEAQAMKQAAETGQQQAIPKKQSNPQGDDGAAQQMQQNQQAGAQQKHKEIEIGIEMMLDQLRKAEQARLEQLKAELAQLQELVAKLIARQAWHNLDSLALMGAAGKIALAAMKPEDAKALYDLAGREPTEVAKKIEQRAASDNQRQTHGNAEALTARAQKLEDTAAAAKLSAAAGRMEQAVVYIDQARWADAYQPPQVEALAHLVAAKQLLDDAKKKADDQSRQNQEETVKQAYVKLLEQQKKLDARTKEIDGNRDADGNIKRKDLVDLADMPRQQKEIAEEVQKQEKKLLDVGSLVYAWANRDLVKSMGEVKEDLAKPETGVVTQAQQTRIEEQFAAMIENLAKKPPEKPQFEQRAGGGGGGGGQPPPPKMPTDVELRLLRALQEAVNKATTTIDNAVKQPGGKKDEPKLVGLGGRQKELRDLFGQLLEKATEGEVKLGEEPSDLVELPEEAGAAKIEEQELTKDLLDGKDDASEVEKVVGMLGDRMGRSRQRLGDKKDPGQTTQEIQKRIILDLDNLIKLAQQQQQQQGGGQGQGQGQAKGKAAGKPGEGQGGGPQGDQIGLGQGGPGGQGGQGQGSSPAGDSQAGPGGEPKQDLSSDAKENLNKWGIIPDRDRQAVTEGGGERNAPKYDQYINDYYKELAKRAAESR